MRLLDSTGLRVAALLTVVAILLGTQATSPRVTDDSSGPIAVIVIGEDVRSAATAVDDVAGSVTRPLPIIDGVAATVPASGLSALTAAPGVVSVSADGRLEPLSEDEWEDAGDDAWEDSDASSPLEPHRRVLRDIRAPRYWQDGWTGQGVGVALIDTGVLPVEGLDDPGKLLHGPDLSLESPFPEARHLDTYGHGTNMAGLIAGRDEPSPSEPWGPPTAFRGVAPDAHIISLKVADAYGAVDVSQVIAAIDWVVAHKDDPGLNIRILNLSYGVHSGQSHEIDPLAHAVEVAWSRGIVVVAAAGNGGAEREGLTSPAYTPRVIAVGAADTTGDGRGSAWRRSPFSAIGADGRAPDLLAPGHQIISLRAPGSYLDRTYGSQAAVGERFFRGSGTSQATALVSGAAALLLSANPGWTPDQVKAHLVDRARRLDKPEFNIRTGRRGLILRPHGRGASPATQQDVQASRGGGSLEQARGGMHLQRDGELLTGEQNIFGQAIDTVALAEGQRQGSVWQGGEYLGITWTGEGFEGNAWAASDWSGETWSGHQWSGQTWSGHQWSGASWEGDDWNEQGQSTASWSSQVWG